MKICDLDKGWYKSNMKLEVKNVSKMFGDKKVLNEISFVVESGKTLGLLGRNGAGKTTLIRILMGVFNGDEGMILLNGEEFVSADMKIGYLPEERGLYPKRTVIEQIMYLAQLRGLSQKQARINSKIWLEKLQVKQYENSILETLSKGNQQKVQLATTLVCDPPIIILDEPFSGLDPFNSQILRDVIKELTQKEKIVVFSSHQMNFVEEFCEEIVIINEGNIILKGNLNSIKKEQGKGRLVLSDEKMSCDELINFIQTFSEYVKVDKCVNNAVVLQLRDGMEKEKFLKILLSTNKLKIERFETFKPSLNDIFIEKVGEIKL